MKKLLLLSLVLISTMSFAKDTPKVSAFNYESSVRNETVDGQVRSYDELRYVDAGVNETMVVEYKRSSNSPAPVITETIEIEKASGDVLLRRTNKPTITIGKVSEKRTDNGGVITLNKEIKAQMIVVKKTLVRECVSKLIDTCLVRGFPKTIKTYQLVIFKDGAKIFGSVIEN